MHSFHLRQLLNFKCLIVVGAVSLLITFLLLMFSDDLHHHSQVSRHKKQTIVADKSSENDKKMFHWMAEDEAKMRMDNNETNKLYENRHLIFQTDTRPPLTVPRIIKYCNPPFSQDVGSEGLVTEDYKLLNVHVVIRHGDRAPIGRLPSLVSNGLSCLMDTSQYSHLPKVTNFVHQMAAMTQKMSKLNRFHKWALYPSHTKCSDGQLTGLGALQHILYGMHYNERYLQKHGLFDETNWHKKVVAHTTEVPRTFQSAIAFLYGILPSFNLDKINLKSSSNINFCEEKVFGSACTCPGIEAFRNKASQECRMEQSYIEVMKKYRDVLEYVQNVLNVPPKEVPYAVALMDGLSSYACHNVPPPCNSKGMCITAKAVESIWEPVDHQSNCFHRNENYKKYTQANMHGLLYRIAQKMNLALNNKAIPSFFLYSGHDTTVSPLITALELEDAVWPGYATRITFELYQRMSTREHLIRVLQNGKVVTSDVVFCRNKTEADFCPFKHFHSHVTGHDLQNFCNSLKFTVV